MKSEEELRSATTATGADLRAERVPGLALITPLNDRAATWLRMSVTEESSWRGEMLVVEMRYFPALVDTAIDYGLMFER